MRCKNCNGEINDNSIFCNFCGTKITKFKKTNLKRKIIKWIIIGGSLCTIIITLISLQERISNYFRYNSIESGIETDQFITQNTKENEIISYPISKENIINIPEIGNELDVSVNSDEIKVLTGGPALINGVSLPGGADPDRGSIIVMLPTKNITTEYHFDYLIERNNCVGSYHIVNLDSNAIEYIINERINLMKKPPNGTSELGCEILDILIVQDDKIIDQWVVR